MQVKHRAESLISANHYDPQSVREIAEEVTKRWQQLVTSAEERHKLVTASLNFYKTAEQVSDISLHLIFPESEHTVQEFIHCQDKVLFQCLTGMLLCGELMLC